MDEKKLLWDIFAKSGAPDDYLRYCRAKEGEADAGAGSKAFAKDQSEV